MALFHSFFMTEISPGISLEGMMLKLKLQYFGTSCEELTHWQRSWCWERLRQEDKGTTEDEMVGWDHWLNGHDLGQTPGVGDRQGGLVCCGPWGNKESDKTERLNWTDEKKFRIYIINRNKEWTVLCAAKSVNFFFTLCYIGLHNLGKEEMESER